MLSASLVTAFGILFAFWFVAGAYIYLALGRQIAARISPSSEVTSPTFGLAEASLAGFLILWFLILALASVSHPSSDLSSRSVIASLLITVAIVAVITGLLRLRGRNVEALAGFYRMSVVRAVGTGAILLFFAYPLISIADVIIQQFLHGSSSKQSIVELFNSSQTIEQRITIIVFAVTIAPAAEEFIFRFFLYGVLKRYFGLMFALVANSLLFAAVHGHLPSFAALFVLGSCFTIAYEWSGSILVSMTMHSLFNALTLVVLAFPETFLRQ
jgi:membrane protease YdiL (CAAX protease family)